MGAPETKLYAITKMKCPRCHEGDLFEPGTAYHFTKFTRMYKCCQECSQTFEPEPGFYFGAMIVSYAISSAIFIAVWVGLSLLVERVTLTMMMVSVVVIVVGLLPINYQLSRSIWINAMVKYKGPNVPK